MSIAILSQFIFYIIKGRRSSKQGLDLHNNDCSPNIVELILFSQIAHSNGIDDFVLKFTDNFNKSAYRYNTFVCFPWQCFMFIVCNAQQDIDSVTPYDLLFWLNCQSNSWIVLVLLFYDIIVDMRLLLC